MTARVSRRRWLTQAACLTVTGPASALGRIPYGGVVTSSLPWDLSQIDPHDLNDPVAGFLGPLLHEPLFATDAHGNVYPTLAAGMPTARGDVVEIALRSLRWPNGKEVTAEHVAWSLERSRQRGAKALLTGSGAFRPVGPRLLQVTTSQPELLASALSSPLTAVLSPQATARDTLGLGPFRGSLSGGSAELTRNLFASRGAPFLERVHLRRASSLADALREFEAHQNNLGWFGRGLHEPRPDSRLLDAGHAGWVVLHAGQQSGRWSRPGAVSALIGAIPPASLERFGLRTCGPFGSAERYTGGTCALAVRQDAPYLVELATTLAAILGGNDGPVSVALVSPKEIIKLKRTRQFGFLLDQVRALGPSAQEHHLSLLTEAGLTNKPPRLPPGTTIEQVPALVCPTLSLSVVGALHLIWATLPDFEWAGGNLANAWRIPKPSVDATEKP